ncbi:D-sedoheptulose-7-phosphate isomerase [Microbacterium sp. SLBN-154]|uniref:D-sedoheptulose-7-phosphate isomerase n=1 Tax=Microbacterium sp. SLBN-154 TaxID=2768458 RepID=UPI00114D7AA3|nr:SIS domain-containing protein [Microbacterium sp. SLBN-154]
MNRYLSDGVDRYLAAASMLRNLEGAVAEATETIKAAFIAGGHLYCMGNGGSAADAQHFVGELIGHYRHDRAPLPAVALGADATTMTCIANDYDFSVVYARQITALARRGDVVAAFTTSGRSANIVQGLEAARRASARTILFTGSRPGPADEHADIVLRAPAALTPRIQEVHTFLLHTISEELDDWAFAHATATSHDHAHADSPTRKVATLNGKSKDGTA